MRDSERFFSEVLKVGKRSFVHYRLTEKGASILKEIAKINSEK